MLAPVCFTAHIRLESSLILLSHITEVIDDAQSIPVPRSILESLMLTLVSILIITIIIMIHSIIITSNI